MRITFQPSGGRGEYELSENAAGIKPVDLIGYTIQLTLGSILIDVGVRVTNDQGKIRLRLINSERFTHVQHQVASALLLPQPVRDERQMGEGEPVLLDKVYVLKNIHLGQVTPLPGNIVRCSALSIDCENITNVAKQILVGERIADVERIWRNRNLLPDSIVPLLERHEQIVRSGSKIPAAARELIDDMQERLEDYTESFEVPYVRRTDIAPSLLSFIDDIVEEVPLPLDQIEPENIELRRREIKKWLQYARRRGTTSEKFKRAVREAYDFRCVVCGARFPKTDINKNPGVDAAHILPWSLYDLDKVYNGLALCKIHHWAFDERLLNIVYRDGAYFIEVSPDAAAALALPYFSIDMLHQVAGPIPAHRLPANPADRPRPELLVRRQNELW
jgi:HNH endonuclease